MVDEMREKAATQMCSKVIRERQTLCPECGKPSVKEILQQLRSILSLTKCPQLRIKVSIGTILRKCGTKLN
jgi:hypothetical protein